MMTKSEKKILLLTGALLASVLAVALWVHYAPRDPPPKPGPPIRLRLAATPKYIGSGLVHIANENDYFKEAGLDVEMQTYSNGKAALEAVFASQADLATAADTPLMFAAMSGRPLLIVATIASEITDHGIVARKNRGIAAPADLKGKRIGVTLGTSGQFFFDVVKAHYRIESTPTALLTNLPPETMAAALARGEVDAVATWSPYLGLAQSALGDNAVRFSDKDIFQYTFNLAGASAYVRANPEAMTRLLRALARAERLVGEHRAQALAIVARATGAGYAPQDPRWDNYKLRLGLDQRLLIQLEDEARWAIRNGYAVTPAVPNFLAFIYPDAMDTVKPDALTIIR